MEGSGRFQIPALFSRDFFTSGFTMVPNLLLRYSASLNLTGTDILVLVAWFYYQQQGKDDVECRDLAQLLNLSEKSVQHSIDGMAASGLVIYNKDHSYNFTGLFEKIVDLWAEEKVQAMQAARMEAATSRAGASSIGGAKRVGRPRTPEQAPAGRPAQAGNSPAPPTGQRQPMPLPLLEIFEREFGRALSQIESATITGWCEEKGFPEELVLEALKKAVLRGALNLTYIERILEDWHKKNLRTVQEVEKYELQYLSARQSKKEKTKSRIEPDEDKYKDLFVI